MNESNIQANCISRDKTKDLVTLDQHFENALRHARTEFESTGMIKPQFECVTEGETFHVCANWSNRGKGLSCPLGRSIPHWRNGTAQ